MKGKKHQLVMGVILVFAANVILGLGIALLRLSGFGTDPYTCMNLGISGRLNMNFGTYQMLLNALLFIPVFILDRRSFGVGALVNMFLLGYFVEFFMYVFSCMGITIEGLAGSLGIRILVLFVGIGVVCFGIALYLFCDLGAAPYDRLSVIVETYSHGRIPFRWARVCLDIFSAVVGIAMGAVVGIGTVIIAFFTGPVVSFFRERIIEKMFGDLKGQAINRSWPRS